MAADPTHPATTHADLLELRGERDVMQEGFHFLDEKRLLLASESLRQLAELDQVEVRLIDLRLQAQAALRALILQEGLEGAKLFPVGQELHCAFQLRPKNFLGTHLQVGNLALQSTPQPHAARRSEAAKQCSKTFQAWLESLADHALLLSNLRRLVAEYKRTERRARAIEDVLLPESDTLIRNLEDRLEDIDQEEAVRVRLSSPGND